MRQCFCRTNDKFPTRDLDEPGPRTTARRFLRRTVGYLRPVGCFSWRPLCKSALTLSPRITCSSINRRHVVVTYGSCITVVPIYRNAAPGFSFDRTLVFDVAAPEDAVSNL